jgi:hypothetical protein
MGDNKHYQQTSKRHSNDTSSQSTQATAYSYRFGLFLFVLCGILLTIFAMILL